MTILPLSSASESTIFLPTSARGSSSPGPRPRPLASGTSRNSPLRGRRRWRRCLLGSAFYVVFCGAAAFCLIALLHLSGYRTPSRDLGLSRQSQANIGALTHSNDTTVLDVEDSTNRASSAPNGTALPPHPWDPFIVDILPLTDLTSRACYFPPWTFFTVCAPSETPSDVALHGHWIRVPRDIGHKASRSYQELYYRRALSLDNPALEGRSITGVRVIEDSESSKPAVLEELKAGGWEPTGDNLRADVWPLQDRLGSAHLWITRAKEVDGLGVDPINEVDLLWGEDAEVSPWWGFERLGASSVPIYGGPNDPDRVRTEVVIRRNSPSSIAPLPSAPDKLRFSSVSEGGNGTFRVLQVADLHFSTTRGECRDVGPGFRPRCEDEGADATTESWIRDIVRKVEPGLIVLTGDQLNGQGTSWDQLSVLLKIGHLFGDVGVPWTAIFGNHDSEDGLPRKEQMKILRSMPYFVGEAGPGSSAQDAEGGEMGIGNFILPIYAPEGGQDEQLFSLFFLDSHAYAGGAVKHAWDKVTGTDTEYDFIKPEQIDWFVRTASSVPAVLRPFSPAASSSDVGDSTFGIWGAENVTATADEDDERPFRVRPRRRKRAGDQVLKRPSAILFQHIPLPEAYDVADADPATGAEKVFGHRLEGEGSPKHNSGFFENGILKVTELDTGASRAGEVRGVEGSPTVKVVVNGHCHITDECRRVRDVWHCFGGGSSYAGYGNETFERRVRVLEVDGFGERVKTWKVLDPRVVPDEDRAKERWEETELV